MAKAVKSVGVTFDPMVRTDMQTRMRVNQMREACEQYLLYAELQQKAPAERNTQAQKIKYTARCVKLPMHMREVLP